MDPLSIAASVAGITSTCLSTGKAIYDFSCKYQDAPRNMVAISTEATVISASLSQMQHLILTKQNPEQLLRSRPEIAATLDTSLTGCMVLFTCLDEELREVSRHARGNNSLSWRGKLKTVWKQDKFQELLDGIRGQQTAINTLIQLLQMDSLMEITQLLQQRAPELKENVERTESLRRSHPSVRMKVAESIFSQEDRMSVYSAADSIMASSELEFDFDDIIVNSAAYRRALAAARQPKLFSQTEEINGDLIDFSDDATLRQRATDDHAEEFAAISQDLLGLNFAADINESTFSLDALAELQQVQGASNSRDVPIIVSVEAPAKVEVKRKPVTLPDQDDRLSAGADALARSRTTTPLPASPEPDATSRSRSVSMPDDTAPAYPPDTPKSQQLEIHASSKTSRPASMKPTTQTERTADASHSKLDVDGVGADSGSSNSALADRGQKASATRICRKCDQELTGQFVRALGTTYHLDCFVCNDCGKIVASKFFPLGQPPNQIALCETDYFRRLDLLCHSCGGALRGAYITAIDKKYHTEHFTCSLCPVVFGADDSYVEHEGLVLCFYHYATKYAQICHGCGLAIMKQFVEISRNGSNQHWHPECYMIHKYWYVRMGGSLSIQKMENNTWTNGTGQELTQETFNLRSEAADAKIQRIWSVLSTFEEKSAAAISDSLQEASNGNLELATRSLGLLIVQIRVLFLAIDAISKRRARDGLPEVKCSRESKLLCKKCVALMQLYAELIGRSGSSIGMTQELLSIVTGIAHYLKLMIRIGLTVSQDDPEPFLQDMIVEQSHLTFGLDLSKLAESQADECASCRKPVETTCFRKVADEIQLWHGACLECASCRRTGAYGSEASPEDCQFCGERIKLPIYRVTTLEQNTHLLFVALARLFPVLKMDFTSLNETGELAAARTESIVLDDIPRLAQSKSTGSHKKAHS